MFVQFEDFVDTHRGNMKKILIYGQESNPNTWRLAHMNLAMHTIEAILGETHADTLLKNFHRDRGTLIFRQRQGMPGSKRQVTSIQRSQ